ncbi:GNAT family N-acetyltransferase [Lysobacter tyrosinilyticus]
MVSIWKIRPIEPRDESTIAAIIRTVMPEYGATGEGFAINDPEVDWMQRAYSLPRSVYFVVEQEGKVVGGGGIAPLTGGDEDTCELRKMYFLKQIRGQGIGSEMLKRCLDTARSFGFRYCYLETLGGMNDAIRLYERHGFKRIGAPRGRTGHGGCDTYYLREL